ncbi:MAG: sigma-70 family RNA polymerase sigma factor, partial [Tepidisphaeraceae bacterium]
MSVLTRAIQGDAQALQDVLTAHHPRLLEYVSRHLPVQVRNLVDPADVVQDTCFEACRLIGKFKPAGKNSTFRWLVTIARHRIVDLLRIRQARQSGKSGDHAPGDSLTRAIAELAVYRRTPSRSAASHEFLAAVEQAIGRLPPVYRQVVTLRHIDGLDTAETAAKMDRTP